MKILLVNPRQMSFVGGILPPLGLAYIAANLEKHGHIAEIFDMNALNLSGKDLIKKLDEKFECVGFTACTPDINHVMELCKIVKEYDSSVLTIVGGPHVSGIPETTIQCSSVDITVIGEGEQTILEIAEKKSLNEIKGIAYNQIINDERPLENNLDILPFPARHLLPLDKYSAPLVKYKPFMTILTSRGCPFKCTFCYHFPSGRYFRARSSENVIAEFDSIVQLYNAREVDIIDDCFNLDINRTKRICEGLIEKGYNLVWRCSNGIRINFITKELLTLMQKSGCIHIALGVESGDQRILNNIQKGTNLDKVREVFSWCHELGIETTALMMIGNIGENRETIQRSIDFVSEIEPDYANWGIAIPFPTTEFHNWVSKNGKFLTENFEDYGHFKKPIFEVPPDLTANLMLEMYQKAYRSFYFRSSYIIKRLLKIKSLSELSRAIKSMLEIWCLSSES